MKKNTIYSLVLVGLFCSLAPVYAADNSKGVTAMLGLLFGNSGGTVITKSVSGQPGVVVTIVLGDDHPAGNVKYVKMGDKEVTPLTWNDKTNEIQATVPPVAAGQYQASVVFEDAQTPTIPLTVLPFSLPEGVTPDSVLADVDQNMQAIFQSITNLMTNTSFAQTNLDTLNGIFTVFMGQYSLMTDEEKKFFATYLNNIDLAGLLKEMETAGTTAAAQAKMVTLKSSPTKPSCMKIDPQTDPFDCTSDSYNRWLELQLYTLLYVNLKKIDILVNDCISYIIDIFGATDCVADAARFARLTKSFNLLGVGVNAMQSILGGNPINMTAWTITSYDEYLKYYDETNFISTATMQPLSTFLTGIINSTISAVAGRLKAKSGAGCLGAIIEENIDHLKVMVSQYTSDELFKVTIADEEKVVFPVNGVEWRGENKYLEFNETYCSGTVAYTGSTIVNKGSVSQIDKQASLGYGVILAYTNPLATVMKAADKITTSIAVVLQNRKPELDPITVKINPAVQVNQEITIPLPKTDQECDGLTYQLQYGTNEQYGKLDTRDLLDKENPKLYYTLTTADPGGNEVFTLRFFDGDEWGETTFTIDLSVVNCTYNMDIYSEYARLYTASCTELDGEGNIINANYTYNIHHNTNGDPTTGCFIWRGSIKKGQLYAYGLVPENPDLGESWKYTSKEGISYTCSYYVGPSGLTCAKLSSSSSGTLSEWCNDGLTSNSQQCKLAIKNLIPPDIISQYLHRGSCSDWWDHEDEQGNWVECIP